MAARSALVVASDDYADVRLGRLRAPAVDAEHLARVLGDSSIGNFEVEVLHNEPEHRIRRRLSAFFSNRDRDDLLVVHFSCHGVKDDNGHLYFASSDTEMGDLDATAVSAEFVNRQMARSRSRRIALFLDCCYSGAFSRGVIARAGDQVDLADRFDGRGQVVITASTSMEYAFEGDELSGEGTPSVFTSALVDGLETGAADLDGDSLVSIDELYEYLYEHVRERNPNQTPSKWVYDLRGDLYVARAPESAQKPAELPVDVQDALGSSFVLARENAVEELGRLLGGRHRGLALAAEQALEQLAADDSRRVSEAAKRTLAEQGEREPAAGLVDEPTEVESPAAAAEPEPEGPATLAAAAALAPTPSVEERPRRQSVWLFGVVGLAVVGAGLAITAIALDWLGPRASFAAVTIGAPLLAVAAALLMLVKTLRPVGTGSLAALGAGITAGAVSLFWNQFLDLFPNHELWVVGGVAVLVAGALGVWRLLLEGAPWEHPVPPSRVVPVLAILGGILSVAGIFLPFASKPDEVDYTMTDAFGGSALLEPIVGLAVIATALLVALLAPTWRHLANGLLLGSGSYLALLFLAYIAYAPVQHSGASPAAGAFLGLLGGGLVIAAAVVSEVRARAGRRGLSELDVR